jgi:hypothetical protein
MGLDKMDTSVKSEHIKTEHTVDASDTSSDMRKLSFGPYTKIQFSSRSVKRAQFFFVTFFVQQHFTFLFVVVILL